METLFHFTLSLFLLFYAIIVQSIVTINVIGAMGIAKYILLPFTIGTYFEGVLGYTNIRI